MGFNMPVFIIMALIFILGINFYLSRRCFHWFGYLFPKANFGIYIGIFAIITLIILLGFFRSMLPMSQGIRSFLGVINAFFMGVFVYLLLYTLLADGIYLVIKLFKPQSVNFIRFICGICAIVFTLVTVGYGFFNAKQLKVVNYQIRTENQNLGNDLKIALISDLHLGAVGTEGRLEDIVEKVNSLQPDVICIAGDFFDSDFNAISDPEKAIKTIRGLQSKYGTYLCFGNHDAGSTVPQMLDFIDKCGIIPLFDQCITIDGRFNLVGRLDKSPIGGFEAMKRAETDEVIAKVQNDLPIIVLDHNPAHIDEYGSEVDLILSGHTHKGQIFPGGIITNLMYTVDHGYYRADENSPNVIVTSGVGAWGMPIRVGTSSEVVEIIFKKG